MKFIDNPTPVKSKPLVPVQLTHCLQAGAISDHRQMFACSYPLQKDCTYTRIGTMTEGSRTYDIIKCERPSVRPGFSSTELLFFGQWNDGVGTK